jgi:GGDEF domain-containing protein
MIGDHPIITEMQHYGVGGRTAYEAYQKVDKANDVFHRYEMQGRVLLDCANSLPDFPKDQLVYLAETFSEAVAYDPELLNARAVLDVSIGASMDDYALELIKRATISLDVIEAKVVKEMGQRK